ncbi:flavin reductase family protein [Pseudonocardia phyllosphaerae]|uniref:flavin reductase family protein n=1 Tax=Pseudonocardia phyllosphaerae TaxID=3390502 RepID=UPI00397CECAB
MPLAHSPAPALADALRAAFRVHAAGVAVLTARGPGGPVGMTASSVASVGTDPPALSFSAAGDSRFAAALRDGAPVVVHLLDTADTALAASFAAPGADRFADVRWAELPGGTPWLPEVGTALRCAVLSVTTVGASVLVAAQVAEVLGLRRRGAPLVWADRAFRTVADLPG